MNVTITPTKLHGPVTPPPSKSQAHRLIIAAALASGESVLTHVAPSQDILATIRCMEALGASFTWSGSTLTVQGLTMNRPTPSLPRLDCGESGSTLRFLIPIALAVAGGGVFTGQGRLMERPQKPYFDLFDAKGISYTLEDGVLTVQGQLPPGDYPLPGNVSSQFVTGLLYALPLVEGTSTITLTSPLESEDYVAMTRQALHQAGITLDGYTVQGRQHYSPIQGSVEADWSQAGFFYAGLGLGNDLDIQGLDPHSPQGDRRIVSFYEQLTGPEQTVTLDVSQCPDLVPPLAALAAGLEGKTIHIVGAARLRIKESDRLATTSQVLNELGAQVEELSEGLTIRGVAHFAGGVTVPCHNDHRIAMMAAMAATRCEAPITLTGAQCVAKSFPDFWEVYEQLGGTIVKSEEIL